MTNGDLVRNMSDEKLAEFITAEILNSSYHDYFGHPFEKDIVYSMFIDWLKRGADEKRSE